MSAMLTIKCSNRTLVELFPLHLTGIRNSSLHQLQTLHVFSDSSDAAMSFVTAKEFLVKVPLKAYLVCPVCVGVSVTNHHRMDPKNHSRSISNFHSPNTPFYYRKLQMMSPILSLVNETQSRSKLTL